MPVAWFLCPYKGNPEFLRERYCAINDFTANIWLDNGSPENNSSQFWSETEVLGDYAIVKVRASVATIADIAAAPGFKRLPKDLLNASLSDLTNPQKIILRDQIEALGYPRAEWQARLGTDLGSLTMRDVLKFVTTRRLKPRFDIPTSSIICDGEIQSCRDVDLVDQEVN